MFRLATLTAAAAFALAAGFAGPANAIDLSAGLVGHWSFDVDQANPTDDVSPTDAVNNTGAITGATYNCTPADIAPIFGNVCKLDFTSTGDRVVVTDEAELQTTGSFTYSAWINVNSTGGFAVIMAKWENTGSSTGGIFFALDGDKLFARLSTTGANVFDATSATAVTTGVWHHVAVVLDTATTTSTVYLDGVADGFKTDGALTSVFANNGIDVTIGSYKPSGSFIDTIDGEIDDARIYNRALSVLEIATLANSFPGTVEKELVSGPNDDAGAPIVVDVNPFDAGGIEVSRPSAQHFEIKITITNDGEDGAIDGLKVFDVFGAEFDPDPVAEDRTDTGVPDCEGTGEDDVCDGIQVVSGIGSCTAEINPHDARRKLDPHFVSIVLIDLEEGETCMVTVWVETSENPASAKGKKDPKQWEPTSCDLVMAPDLFNTFTLNEGLKVFDPQSGIRLLGPVGSLQLTCNFPD